MKHTALLSLLALLAAQPADCGTRTWDGGDASSNMMAALNWNPNTVPLAGDGLIFPAGLAPGERAVNNNFAANTQFDSLTFNDGGYSLGGVILKLSGDLQATDAGTVTINAGITRTGSGAVSASGGAHLRFGASSQLYQGANPMTLNAAEGSVITVDGFLSAPDNLLFDGGGLVILNGAKSLAGSALIWNETSVALNHGHGLGSGGAGRIDLVSSKLEIDSVTNQTLPRELRMSGVSPWFYSSGGDHTYSGNWRLFGSGHRYIQVSSGSLTLSGTVAAEGEDDGVLVKRGLGTLRLTGPEGNAFTDTLRVDEGMLELDKPGFTKKAVSCTYLQVGDGAGVAGSARVVLQGHSQIADEAYVTVSSDGYLDLDGHAQWLGDLLIRAGGTVDTGNGIGLFLPGELVVTGGNLAAPATITGEVIIMGADREWLVNDFGVETELVCAASLTKNAAMPNDPASVIFNGTGSVTLAGDHDIDSLTWSSTGRLTGAMGTSEGMDLTLNSGTLSGSWNAGGISPDGGVGDFIAIGGVVDLRDDAETRLLVCRSCTLGSASTYRYQAEHEGAQQDAILARVSLSIDNAVLEFTPPPGPDPSPGTEFTIIYSDHAVAQGQFLGMPEGTILNGKYFLSYHGGSGEDVTATVIVPPTGVTRTWDGGGVNSLWMTAANWTGNIAPQQGDALVFPLNAQRKTNTNNFADGTGFHSITVAGGDYQISGSRILLNDGLHFTHAAGTPQWSAPLEFLLPGLVSASSSGALVNGLVDFDNNPTALRKDDGPGELTFSGGLNGDHPCSLHKTGAGIVRVTQASDFNGPVRVEEGRLTVSHNDALSVDANYISVFANAELRLDPFGGPALTVAKQVLLAGTLSVAVGPQCEWSGGIVPTSVQGGTVRTEGSLLCTGTVDGYSPLRKTGPGVLTLNGDSPAETGALFVDEGEVRLALTAPDALLTSPVVIGSAEAAAKLTLTSANQLGDDVEVHVGASGWFEAGAFSDTFGTLSMTGGSVTGTSATPLTVKTGLVTTHSAAMPAVISARVAPAVGVNGRFDIAGGNASPDLSIQSRVYGVVWEKTGAGRVDFTVNQPPDAFDTLDLQQGSALIFSNCQFTGVQLNGGTLGGHGTVGEITAVAGGEISPGASPGVLGGYKAVWNGATTLRMELDGLNPGAEYDQYSANGLTDLGGARLTLTAAFDPAPGDSFMIIRNVSGAPVAGTFAGLPQNGYVSAPGAKVFQINYTGGDGDDVMLTRVETVPPEIVTFTATPGANPDDDTDVHFVFEGTPGLSYLLKSSTDLDIWQPVQFAVADLFTGQMIIDLAEPAGEPRRFYQLCLP